MAFKRWYDKDEILRQIITLLENADEETQTDIANDIIQLMIDKQFDVDDFIQVINTKNLESKNRWYDKNDTLHSAVEMLKDTDAHDRQELLNEILTMFFNFSNEEILKYTNSEDV